MTFNKGRYNIENKKIEKAGKDSILRIKSRKVREEASKWDANLYWDDEKNWSIAEYYVKQYYENIIPAVMDRDKECAFAIMNAFNYSMKGPYRIINTFEMALAVYFISTDAISRASFPG